MTVSVLEGSEFAVRMSRVTQQITEHAGRASREMLQCEDQHQSDAAATAYGIVTGLEVARNIISFELGLDIRSLPSREYVRTTTEMQRKAKAQQEWLGDECPEDRARVYRHIDKERQRQIHKWGRQDGWNDSDGFKYGVLVEELGEVGRATIEQVVGQKKPSTPVSVLFDELIQVAAVAVAWIEQSPWDAGWSATRWEILHSVELHCRSMDDEDHGESMFVDQLILLTNAVGSLAAPMLRYKADSVKHPVMRVRLINVAACAVMWAASSEEVSSDQ